MAGAGWCPEKDSVVALWPGRDWKCCIAGLSNWRPAGRMRPSDQLSVTRQDVLTN
jgi:hypothetical protein